MNLLRHAHIITTKTTTNKTMKTTNNDCVGIRGNKKKNRFGRVETHMSKVSEVLG
jgi:hypothetical protein